MGLFAVEKLPKEEVPVAVLPKPAEVGGGLGLVELNVKGVVVEGAEPKADVEENQK